MRGKNRRVQSHMGITLEVMRAIRESLFSCDGDEHKRKDGYNKSHHDDARA